MGVLTPGALVCGVYMLGSLILGISQNIYEKEAYSSGLRGSCNRVSGGTLYIRGWDHMFPVGLCGDP